MRTRYYRRGYTVAVVGLAALAVGVVWSRVSVAGADPLTDCTTSAGTIVAVDFAHWHGPVVRGCARQAANGLDLLHSAGFTTAGDVHDGPGFVCRLGNAAFAGGTQYPRPNEDACVLTPPTNAYWSFWTAPAGSNRWTYSTTGAMSDVPNAGEVELWTFGGANGSAAPAITPSSLRAPASPPSTAPPSAPPPTVAPQAIPPSPPTTSTANVTSPAVPNNARVGATSKRTTRTSAGRSARVPATTTTTAHAATAAHASTPSGGGSAPIVAAQPIRAIPHSSSGPPWSLVVAVFLLGALGAGTAAAVRRRKLAARSREAEA